jgi:BirA family transcriptional regulator, biotin operon repressor / biotin---[acetyl-CoA-carboxylase] ligase
VASNGSAGRLLLCARELRETLVRPGGLWQDVRVVAETGSTNSDLLAEARSGLATGAVLVADAQTAGRGRMGRHWVSPPGSALTFSVLLRPAAVPPASRGWMPLLAGVAVARAVHAETRVDARLKWPNDVQVNGGKLAGILAEQAGDAIVVGIGINVSSGRDELPVAGATSLALAGPAGAAGAAGPAGPAGAAGTSAGRLLVGVLGEMEHWYRAWTARLGDATACGLHQEYQRGQVPVGTRAGQRG